MIKTKKNSLKTLTLLILLTFSSCSPFQYCQKFTTSFLETEEDIENKFKVVWSDEEEVTIQDSDCKCQKLENTDREIYFVGDSIYLDEIYRR